MSDIVVSAIVAEMLLKQGLKPCISSMLNYVGLSTEEGNAIQLTVIAVELNQIKNSIKLVENKIDENRLASLWAGFEILKDANQMQYGRTPLLEKALADFYLCKSIPSEGRTGGRPNSELRCLSLVGLAITHLQLGNSEALSANMIAQAITENPATAKRFVEQKYWDEILEIIMKDSSRIDVLLKDGYHSYNEEVSFYQIVADEEVKISVAKSDKYGEYTYSKIVRPGSYKFLVRTNNRKESRLVLSVKSGVKYSLVGEVLSKEGDIISGAKELGAFAADAAISMVYVWFKDDTYNKNSDALFNESRYVSLRLASESKFNPDADDIELLTSVP